MTALETDTSITDHKSPPLILNAQQVKALIPRIDVVSVLKKTFLSLAHGKSVQPAQTLTLLPENAGDFITYSGAISELEVFGAKLSPYIVSTGKPLITAWTYLMSLRTGQPLLCCDSAELTVERTAGVTALAVDTLAKSDSDILCIVGSGQVVLAHLQHVLTVRKWQDIRVFSPNLAMDMDRQQSFKAIYPSISIVHTVEDATDGAHVIMLCTSSGTPVLDTSTLQAGVLVTSISTNAAEAHEVSPALLSVSDVYCDYKDTAPYSAGEMQIAIKQGSWAVDKLKGDLPSLMARSCALPAYDKPVFFRSIGLGLEDVAIAYSLWVLAQTQG